MFNFCQQVNITQQNHYHQSQDNCSKANSVKSFKSRKSTKGLSCTSARKKQNFSDLSQIKGIKIIGKNDKKSHLLHSMQFHQKQSQISILKDSSRLYQKQSQFQHRNNLKNNKSSISSNDHKIQYMSRINDLDKVSIGFNVEHERKNYNMIDSKHKKAIYQKRRIQNYKINLRIENFQQPYNYVQNPEITMTPLRINCINKKFQFGKRISDKNNVHNQANFRKNIAPLFRKNILNEAKSIVSDSFQDSQANIVVQQSVLLMHNAPKLVTISLSYYSSLWKMYMSYFDCKPYPVISIKQYHDEQYAFNEYRIWKYQCSFASHPNILQYYQYMLQKQKIIILGEPYTTNSINITTFRQDITNALQQLQKNGLYLHNKYFIEISDIVQCCNVNKFHALGKLTTDKIAYYAIQSIVERYLQLINN